MAKTPTFDELLEQEVRSYPALFIWNKLTRLVAIVPVFLTIMSVICVNNEYPDEFSGFIARSFLYILCYFGFLKSYFESKTWNAPLVIFSAGIIAFFVNNLFNYGMSSILGILTDMVIVWLAVCILNYSRAYSSVQHQTMDFARHVQTREMEAAEKAEADRKASEETEARNAARRAVSKTAQDLVSESTYSEAFKRYQENADK